MYKLHSEHDSKVQRMALTAALDNTNIMHLSTTVKGGDFASRGEDWPSCK